MISSNRNENQTTTAQKSSQKPVRFWRKWNTNSRSKPEIRQWWKGHYPKDEGERKKRSRPVQDLLVRSEIFLDAPTVAIYAAREWEVDLKILWQKRPEACVFPRCLPLTTNLEFYRIGDWNDLKPGYKGLLEPNVSEGFRITQWKEGSLILVPAMAFNREGGRIGGGKGYYDRFLGPLSPKVLRWGVGFAEQLLQEKFPLEPTDVRMHAIVTDAGFHPVDV